MRQIGEDRPTPSEPTVALDLIMLALRALGARALVAAGHIAATAALASVWWLYNEAIPANPSDHQLVGLGLYSAFTLAVLWVRRG